MGPAKRTNQVNQRSASNLERRRVEVSSESKIHVDPRAEEEQNHSKPRAEEGRIAASNLVRKRKEVIKSAETLNLAQTEERSISMSKFPDLVRKGEGTSKLSNDSNLERKRIRIAKIIRNF